MFSIVGTIVSKITSSTWDYKFNVVTDHKSFAEAEKAAIQHLKDIKEELNNPENMKCLPIIEIEYLFEVYKF